MKTNKKKELCIDILVDIAAGILIAIGTYNFATTAKFPLSGFNGIGLIFYHLWGLPIGTVALVLNIPVAIACYKTLGKGFMLRSIRSILITSIIMDYVAPLFPLYTGEKLLAMVCTAVLSGLGYADDFYARVLDRWYRFYSADHQGKKAVLDDREYLLCDGICRGVDRHCADFEGY